MRNKVQRESDFRRELQEFLDKHGAEIEITDDGRSYGMHCGVVNINMPAKFDDNGEILEEYTDFRL